MWAWQAIHTSSPDCCLPRQTNTEFASFVFNGTCGHGNMSGFGNFCFSCAMPSPLTVSVSANEQRICLFCVPGTRGQKQFFEFGGFVFFCAVLWRLHPSAVEQRICQFCVPGISLPYEYKDDTTRWNTVQTRDTKVLQRLELNQKLTWVNVPRLKPRNQSTNILPPWSWNKPHPSSYTFLQPASTQNAERKELHRWRQQLQSQPQRKL